MRNTLPLFVVFVSLSLAGCFGDGDEPSGPEETGSTKIEESIFGGEEPNVNSDFRPFWDPSIGLLPYPNDLLGFLANGSTDGSLNLRDFGLLTPLVDQLNQLDGFSPNARMQANFSSGIDAGSLSPANVFLLEVAVDARLRVVLGLADDAIIRLQTTGNPFLVQGEDYEVSVASDIDSGGATIQLKPLKPLNEGAFQTLPGNEGRLNAYLVILMGGENGIESSSGTPAVADTTFENIKQGYLAGLIQLPDDPSQLPPDLPLEDQIALFTAAQLATAEALGLNVADIVSTASFSTLNASDVMEAVSALAQAQDSTLQQSLVPFDLPTPGGVIPAGTPVTTSLVLSLLGFDPDAIPGEGDVYAGAMGLPYYLTPAENPQDTAILTEFWTGATGVNPIDPESTVVSRFNPVPVAQADLTIPVLITLPNDNTSYAAALGGTAIKPDTGWPVVIFYHGILGNRLNMFAMTEPFNDAGFAVIAIDQPLHGIPVAELDLTLPPEEIAAIIAETPEVLFRIPGVAERTFDADLITGDGVSGGSPGEPDGVIDRSGAHYINLPTPIVFRDNGRQAASDLITLTRTLPTMDLDNDGTPDFDGSRVYFNSQSLGSINGTIYLAVDPTVVSASLGVGGGTWIDLGLDSFSFGPLLEEGLSAAGLVPNTALYNNYLRDAQNIVDAGDPIMFGELAGANGAIHFIQVSGDETVPNSASNRLAAEIGVTEVSTPGPNIEPAGWVGRVCYTEGNHVSQLDPSASPAATAEMQAQTVIFNAGFPPLMLPGDGQTILIQDPSVIGDFTAGDCQAPDRPRANTQ
jgi:enamine deaminase RidA (YjgF/YER057c/UK114 family)